MKKYLTSLAIKDMQIKTTMRDNFISTRMARIKVSMRMWRSCKPHTLLMGM